MKLIQARAGPIPALGPNHSATLGTNAGEASIIVPSGNSIESRAADHNGLVVLFIPASLVVRLRIGAEGIEAVATDAAYAGPAVYHFPIDIGEVVSLWGDGGTGTATVCMAR
ncbi:MAG TPA: hypothetical protein VMW68_08550 [Methyloceanibacter sp.]|nr:hypothetical protein [Methyloceanibacter sp.]